MRIQFNVRKLYRYSTLTYKIRGSSTTPLVLNCHRLVFNLWYAMQSTNTAFEYGDVLIMERMNDGKVQFWENWILFCWDIKKKNSTFEARSRSGFSLPVHFVCSTRNWSELNKKSKFKPRKKIAPEQILRLFLEKKNRDYVHRLLRSF